jgi:ferredoxin--NADP+ reductase
MYSPNAAGIGTETGSGSRMYVFEVEGIRQNGGANNLNIPIRRSGTTYITVPYTRMSQEMKRINRLGGKIVSIRPLNDTPPTNGSAASGNGT